MSHVPLISICWPLPPRAKTPSVLVPGRSFRELPIGFLVGHQALGQQNLVPLLRGRQIRRVGAGLWLLSWGDGPAWHEGSNTWNTHNTCSTRSKCNNTCIQLKTSEHDNGDGDGDGDADDDDDDDVLWEMDGSRNYMKREKDSIMSSKFPFGLLVKFNLPWAKFDVSSTSWNIPCNGESGACQFMNYADPHCTIKYNKISFSHWHR